MKLSNFLIVFYCLFLASCGHDTERDSDDYATAKERVAALKKEIVAPSDFSDCEFELFNVNGFSDSFVMLPGSSSSRYFFVIKVKPEDVPKWIDDGLVRLDSINYTTSPMAKIIEKRPQNWKTMSKPTVYTRETFGVNNGVRIVIYEEGIIYKAIVID